MDVGSRQGARVTPDSLATRQAPSQQPCTKIFQVQALKRVSHGERSERVQKKGREKRERKVERLLLSLLLV
jgi:hypothetical protein